MEVEVARRDFCTNENPDPSKWKEVSSAWGLREMDRLGPQNRAGLQHHTLDEHKSAGEVS